MSPDQTQKLFAKHANPNQGGELCEPLTTVQASDAVNEAINQVLDFVQRELTHNGLLTRAGQDEIIQRARP